MRVKKPELKRSRRASGERQTYEVAFDAGKGEWRRVEDVEYTCAFCGRLTRGVGYRCKEQTACPQHLDDVVNHDPPPPAPPMPEPVPLVPAAKKRRR